MNRLTGAIIVATFIVALIATFAVAEITVNTPSGTLFRGVSTTITWTISGSAPTVPGIISIYNNDLKNFSVIDNNADLTKLSRSWVVDVMAGTYYYAINDGSGEKTSAPFQVIDRGTSGGGSPPNTASGNTQAATTGGGSSPTSTTDVDTTTPATGTTTGTAGTTTGGSAGGAGATTTSKTNDASTVKSNLLGLFVGLCVVASVMIQLF